MSVNPQDKSFHDFLLDNHIQIPHPISCDVLSRSLTFRFSLYENKVFIV